MAELAHKPTLSAASRSLLSAYRVDEQPDPDVARRSWQALAERVHHPEANLREAWVDRLPVVDEPYGQDDLFADFEDDVALDGGEDDWSGVAARPRVDAWYYAKSVATSVAIAAAVLLGMRVVVTSATTLTQQARGEALEAPYQGDANREGGRAVEGKAIETVTATKRGKGSAKAPAPRTEAVVAVEEAVVQPEAEAPAVTPAEAKSPKARVKPKAATQVDDVEAELALVRQANTAKKAGKLDEALSLLSEHAKDFPGGVLAQEREVLRAEVLCARGDKTQARTLVERFASRHPTSALLGRMNGVCAD